MGEVVDFSPDFSPLSADERTAGQSVSRAIDPDDGPAPTLPPQGAETGEAAAERLFGRRPDFLWRYATADGAAAFFVARLDKAGGEKIVVPVSWIEGAGWTKKAWRGARPLYNLDAISARPDAAIVVAEGEKAADAAAAIFLNSVATTSSGGASAFAKTDWTPLAGRRVLIWPDCDEAGAKYAKSVAAELAALRCEISVVDARALASVGPNSEAREPPPGWDAADALAEGRAPEALRREAFRLAKPFDAGPSWLSFGRFAMGADGLFAEVERGRGEDRTTESVWVSSPFEILGRCRDPDGHGWGKYLRWRDDDGRYHVRHIADAALQGDPAPLSATLADAGLNINRDHQRLFVGYLASATPRGRVTVVRRTGWHEVAGQDVFVLPSEAIGPRGSETVILDGAASAPYEMRGTLDDWRKGIGSLSGEHDLAVLAVSAALAGPLLHLAGQDGGGLHFVGPSSVGKTTLLRAAASIWGRGASPGFIGTWRATANGLEGAAAGASDAALVLDEMGQIDGREASATAYMLANGSGKARAGRDGGLREPKTWRVMLISSGELTLGQKIGEDGKRVAKAGQLVRILDIPAQRAHGVFDHAGPSGKAADIAKAFAVAASEAYGSAGPAFVRKLIAGGVTGEDVREQIGAFVRANVPPASDGQIDRAAQRFGLIAVAGEMATFLGVTPWREGAAAQAAADALSGWIEARGGTEPAEARQAIEQVRRIIEAHGESRFDAPDDPAARPVANRLGWRKGAGADRQWLIPPQVWKAEVCAGLDPVFVARTLAERRMLRRQNGSELQSVVKVDGDSRRVYVVTAAILDGGGDGA